MFLFFAPLGRAVHSQSGLNWFRWNGFGQVVQGLLRHRLGTSPFLRVAQPFYARWDTPSRHGEIGRLIGELFTDDDMEGVSLDALKKIYPFV